MKRSPWLVRYSRLLTCALHELDRILEPLIEEYTISCTIEKRKPEIKKFRDAVIVQAIEGAFTHPMKSAVTGAII